MNHKWQDAMRQIQNSFADTWDVPRIDDTQSDGFRIGNGDHVWNDACLAVLVKLAVAPNPTIWERVRVSDTATYAVALAATLWMQDKLLMEGEGMKVTTGTLEPPKELDKEVVLLALVTIVYRAQTQTLRNMLATARNLNTPDAGSVLSKKERIAVYEAALMARNEPLERIDE